LFEILGTGFYHPVLPLIPEADRHQQLQRWLGIARHVLWRPRYIARHGKDEIVVVVRDRDLSNAQEAGMNVD